MEKSPKQISYEERIYHIQDFIGSHLDQELNLEKLAQISAFSPFHFHRIFKSITGETLYDFIQRVRLEKSCAMLSSNPDLKMINIAMACGFSVPSSFSKAFKSHYGISPSEYRECNSRNRINKSKNGTYYGKSGKEAPPSDAYISDKELGKLFTRRKRMNVKIEELPRYRIAYMRRIGPYGSNNKQLMQQFKKWAITRDLLNEYSIILGIAHDDPEVTQPEKCRYDTCIVIPDDYKLEKNINENNLPGGKYAILNTKHTPEAIGIAWNDLFQFWLPDSGWMIDGRPVFERYLGITKDIEFEPVICEICVPVRKL